MLFAVVSVWYASTGADSNIMSEALPVEQAHWIRNSLTGAMGKFLG